MGFSNNAFMNKPMRTPNFTSLLFSSFLSLALTVSFSATLTACSSQPTAAKNAATEAAKPAAMVSGARISGDYPDPSVIRVNDTYFAVGTTSAWAPAFTLLTSKDLTNWDVAGAVFQTVPAWSDGNYWAPELVHTKDTYFVYYTAKNKKSKRLCVAVASAKAPLGPYKDHGPLVCEEVGSIDGSSVTDENGDSYLLWKTDGNSQQKPTPIHLQKLSKDGTKLVGPVKDTITNDAPWEAKLVEAPYVLKKNNMWYMFYAGSDCCGRECKYAIGVARAKSLEGPWEKNPANPILKSSDAWKCPGHGTVVTDTAGKDIFVYHAYNAKDFNDVGRQVMADGIDWDATTGWPSINNGLGAGLNLNGALPPLAKKDVVVIKDDFASRSLSPRWLWPYNQAPKWSIDTRKTQLRLSTKKTAPLASVIAQTTSQGNYVAKTTIDRASLEPGTHAGIVAIGSLENAFGLSYKNGGLELWQLKDSKLTVLEKIKALPSAKSDLQLRLVARDGHFLRFGYSTDGTSWTDVGSEVDASYLPPWDLSIRVGLSAGGGDGLFNDFTMEPSK